MSRIIITGPGASGKDVLMKRFVDRGKIATVSCTTRPRREKTEVDGVHYNFLDYITFQQMILDKKFWQWKVFNRQEDDRDSWYYGTTWESWMRDELFILTPPAIVDDITPAERKKSFIIYMDIPEAIRRARLAERQDADTVERRLKADEELFAGFVDFDMKITDPAF